MFLWFCIAVRVVANPCSNALQKLLTARGLHAGSLMAVTHVGLTLLSLPWLVSAPPASREFWLWTSLSAALAVAANWLIIEALQRSDLSVLGPINSYKPVVSLIPGLLLLGERLSWPALAGIGLVVTGSGLLVDSGSRRTAGVIALLTERGVQLRFAALLLSAGEAVTLKRALRLAGPELTFAAWASLGALFVLPLALRSLTRNARDLPLDQRAPAGKGLFALILTTGLMQYCTLVTLVALPVGIALALFQTSTLLTVVLGYVVFREPHFQKRLLGAGIMSVGAAVLILTRPA